MVDILALGLELSEELRPKKTCNKYRTSGLMGLGGKNEMRLGLALHLPLSADSWLHVVVFALPTWPIRVFSE